MNSLLLTVFPSYFRDIDKVDELMQDITEQQELAQEISDAISKPVGFGEEFDEVGEALQLFYVYICVVYLILSVQVPHFIHRFYYQKYINWERTQIKRVVMIKEKRLNSKLKSKKNEMVQEG